MSDDQRFAEMISKIAHELRSPLTSVKGFSSTLIKRWDKFTDEQKFQFVETINADADRMGRIVSEVLDLARLETGRFELRAIEIEIRPVAEKAAANHSDLPGADRVEVTVPEGLRAWADPDRLGHVLTNMVENAVKFSDEGAIEVSARPVGEQVEITISDHGVGIEPERVDGVFSGPAPAGQRATPSGTGLGLYLSRLIVEAHGGTISVESELDKGSKFTLLLPSKGPEFD
jgi:signal transduction histidine kinase